ncbi:MAG: DUF1292 domain-containing protein [Bacilli bacterium]|nr:DUF1292 domain-containing protein [Bacilli bacterium]
MKKGQNVTLENGLSFNLVDSVTYEGVKYFAASSDDDTDDTLYFFKVINTDDGIDTLELIEYEKNEKVIDALIQHMQSTF